MNKHLSRHIKKCFSSLTTTWITYQGIIMEQWLTLQNSNKF